MSTKTTKIEALGLAGLIMAVFSNPAPAHHSFAMFDHSRMDVLSGTTTELEWRNPHCWLHLAVVDDAGNELIWSFEMGSIGQLVRDGWAEDSVAAGDAIEIRFHPLKDGSNGGQLRFVELPGGETMCQGNHCAALEDAG